MSQRSEEDSNIENEIRTARRLAVLGFFLEVIWMVGQPDFSRWVFPPLAGLAGLITISGAAIAISAPPRKSGGKGGVVVVNVFLSIFAALFFIWSK